MAVKDILIFIGPQASGKSTISKGIYFFPSLKDDLLEYVLEALKEQNFTKPLATYTRYIRRKFLTFWGPPLTLETCISNVNDLRLEVGGLRGKLRRPRFEAFAGLQNFRDLFFDDPIFWKSLSVTANFALMAVPGVVLLGLYWP